MIIELTLRFKRDLQDLAKRYRHIRSDLQVLIEQLKLGETPGDRIPGVSYTLFKVRLKNRDIQKGKSGGYRVIYYLHSADRIILVTIYSKSDRTDIDVRLLEDIVTEYEGL